MLTEASTPAADRRLGDGRSGMERRGWHGALGGAGEVVEAAGSRPRLPAAWRGTCATRAARAFIGSWVCVQFRARMASSVRAKLRTTIRL
mmetsp:Transcript_127669/g.367429  ORF Transcript_127669/g.367429 Transcript_127669/m.367429 type:complete len:90 (+) Transcript_127669:1499-1768(+)